MSMPSKPSRCSPQLMKARSPGMRSRCDRVANDDSQLILPISEQEIAALEITKSEAKPAKKSAPRKPAPATLDDSGEGWLFEQSGRRLTSAQPLSVDETFPLVAVEPHLDRTHLR